MAATLASSLLQCDQEKPFWSWPKHRLTHILTLSTWMHSVPSRVLLLWWIPQWPRHSPSNPANTVCQSPCTQPPKALPATTMQPSESLLPRRNSSTPSGVTRCCTVQLPHPSTPSTAYAGSARSVCDCANKVRPRNNSLNGCQLTRLSNV